MSEFCARCRDEEGAELSSRVVKRACLAYELRVQSWSELWKELDAHSIALLEQEELNLMLRSEEIGLSGDCPYHPPEDVFR
jgi:hypothetical protein